MGRMDTVDKGMDLHAAQQASLKWGWKAGRRQRETTVPSQNQNWAEGGGVKKLKRGQQGWEEVQASQLAARGGGEEAS